MIFIVLTGLVSSGGGKIVKKEKPIDVAKMTGQTGNNTN